MTHLELLEFCIKSYDHASIRINEVEALVEVHDGVQYVAFRGTETDKMIKGGGWRDVWRDLRAIPWKDERIGWSHAGFMKGARVIVDNFLIYSLDNDKPVVVTGHSLGGGLAINAAALLHAEGYKINSVVTFGSPRTMLKDDAEKWRKILNTTQYSNDGDPVCDVPFRFWGYRHLNEVMTDREAVGWGSDDNHALKYYREGIA